MWLEESNVVREREVISLVKSWTTTINQEEAGGWEEHMFVQKLANSNCFFFFCCCLCLLVNPTLADQVGSGMLVISWTERTVRVGLRQQGGCSRCGRTEAAVVAKVKHGSSVQSLAFKQGMEMIGRAEVVFLVHKIVFCFMKGSLVL